MDKIAGLKEILALDPKNSFARYGLAMELAKAGQTEEAMGEFDTLLASDPDYTAGYFMAAQTLAAAGRPAEAIERLKEGIECAARAEIAMPSVRCRPCSMNLTGSFFFAAVAASLR